MGYLMVIPFCTQNSTTTNEFFFFIDSFERVYREFLSAGSLPRWLQRLELDWSGANSCLGSPTWSIFCFPGSWILSGAAGTQNWPPLSQEAFIAAPVPAWLLTTLLRGHPCYKDVQCSPLILGSTYLVV